MNSLRLFYCILVLCLCFSFCSISAAGKSSKKATKKSQQNTMKRVAEAKAEARRATEAKQKEILRPYVPKSKLPEESETKQDKQKREFQKACLKKLPKTFSLDQRSQFCQGDIAYHMIYVHFCSLSINLFNVKYIYNVYICILSYYLLTVSFHLFASHQHPRAHPVCERWSLWH
jgi:hypothetical protein